MCLLKDDICYADPNGRTIGHVKVNQHSALNEINHFVWAVK